MTAFPKKKKKKEKKKRRENCTYGGMVRILHLVIFGIFFSMLNYGQRSLKSDFPFTFDRQKKYFALKIIRKSRGGDSLTMPPLL